LVRSHATTCGDWETVTALAARELGLDFEVIRANPDPPDVVTDPVAIRSMVEDWRNALDAALRPHLVDGVSWDEGAEAEYFTDKPDWAGYAGLMILAAHTVCPEYPRPERAAMQFDEDAAFQSLAARQRNSRAARL